MNAIFAPNNGNIVKRTLLNGEPLSDRNVHPLNLSLNLLGYRVLLKKTWNVVCFASKRPTSGFEESVSNKPNEPEEREKKCAFDPFLIF